MIIDGLQYANWSKRIFQEMRKGGVSAVHATVAYQETFRETVGKLADWNRLLLENGDLICKGRTASDIDEAIATDRTAIFFGSQNPSVMEDDLGLIEPLYDLGLRFMQLSYNGQSLLATGYQEREDPGITGMGREVIAEMNRVGIVIDMSHSAERSTIEAAEISQRPIVLSHANPNTWCPGERNKSDASIEAVLSKGGFLGFSLYPLHLAGGSDCSLEAFCTMVSETAEKFGAAQLGLGSDLCQDRPGSALGWMRDGRWRRGTSPDAFPPQPSWFQSNLDFGKVAQGLTEVGFSLSEVDGIMGKNWYHFFADNFGAQTDAA